MKKSILLLLPVLALSGCSGSGDDSGKTVIEYLKDPKAMVADEGYCIAHPAEMTTKCLNDSTASRLARRSSFRECLKLKKGSTDEFITNPTCVDRLAKKLHMVP